MSKLASPIKEIPILGAAFDPKRLVQDPMGSLVPPYWTEPPKEPTGFAELRTPPGPATAPGAVANDPGQPSNFFAAHPSAAGFANDPEMRKMFMQGTGPFSRLRMQ